MPPFAGGSDEGWNWHQVWPTKGVFPEARMGGHSVTRWSERACQAGLGGMCP